MAHEHRRITEALAAFIAAQPIFFVASAMEEGRINLSPKGQDGTFKVLGENRVAWLNLTGSGNETAAHLRSGGRVTIMFCAFSGPPLVLKLYGHGRAIHPRAPEWKEFDGLFADYPAKRQIVVVDVESVITSCGFGVPHMELLGQRPDLTQWAERKGADGIAQYWREKNKVSIDGLPTGTPEDAPDPGAAARAGQGTAGIR